MLKNINNNKQENEHQHQQLPPTTNKERIIYERKIEAVTGDLTPHFKSLMQSISEENAMTICDYLISQNAEINPALTYRRTQLQALAYFSKRVHNIPFKQVTNTDILDYLNSLRKPEEKDPLHKWIGTYNARHVYLMRFFKWLEHSELPPKVRPTPACMRGITQLHRKEKSIYKSSDLWQEEDNMLFLKYCTDKRIKAYHMLAIDSSCRPSELLNLRVGDLHFKQSPDGTKQYVEMVVSGKTGTRPIPLFFSVPYIKDWLDDYPNKSNPKAYLIPSRDVMHGRSGMRMRTPSLFNKYSAMKKEFQRLADPNLHPEIPLEDKVKIRNNLLTRKWNPYVFRHSALTQKAKILKAPILKAHAGWSENSSMNLRYEHWFGNESSNALLEAYGVLTPEDNNPYVDVFKPKVCPQCSENNMHDAKFCAKCRMVLTYDAYEETIKSEKAKDDRLTTIENQLKELLEFQQKLTQLKAQTPEEELQSAETLVKMNAIENDMAKAGVHVEKDNDITNIEKKKEEAEEIINRWEQQRQQQQQQA